MDIHISGLGGSEWVVWVGLATIAIVAVFFMIAIASEIHGIAFVGVIIAVAVIIFATVIDSNSGNNSNEVSEVISSAYGLEFGHFPDACTTGDHAKKTSFTHSKGEGSAYTVIKDDDVCHVELYDATSGDRMIPKEEKTDDDK